MRSSATLKWIGLALLGLLIAAGVSIAASRLASQQIGLASEPISAGDALAPARATSGNARGGRSTTTPTTTTTTTTHPTTTAPPPAAPTTTEAPPSPSPPEERGGGGSGGDGERGGGGGGGHADD